MTDLFEPLPPWPEPVLLSIYNAYPRKENRKGALASISKALWRICEGEIDGHPRIQAEAVDFLRLKVEEARRQLGAREKKFIPLPTTWFNGRRYLRPELDQAVEKPKRLMDCMEILAEYPTSPKRSVIEDNLEVWLPALMAIDKALERMQNRLPGHSLDNRGIHCARRLRSRTEIFAMAVKEWPPENLQYVPNPKRFYDECRYEQNEAAWQRKPTSGFAEERAQLQRLVN